MTTIRRARAEDALVLIPLFEDSTLAALQAELQSANRIVLLAESAPGKAVAALTTGVEPEQRLAKVEKLLGRENRIAHLDAFLPKLPEAFKEAGVEIDVVYCTTRFLALDEQARSLQHGYELLGIFPNSPGADLHRVGGLSATYLDPKWREKRHADFLLHPAILPFYELVRKDLGLPQLKAVSKLEPLPTGVPMKPLELIHAPAFVARKFEKLRQRRLLSTHFYPFQVPSALVTDADGDVEVFCRINPDLRFATVIGERVETAIDPVELYASTVKLLRGAGVTYIELLLDAADVAGIDAVLKSGFLPFAYFPAFKAHADQRRDFVVFGLSLQNEIRVPASLRPEYLHFLETITAAENRRRTSTS